MRIVRSESRCLFLSLLLLFCAMGCAGYEKADDGHSRSRAPDNNSLNIGLKLPLSNDGRLIVLAQGARGDTGGEYPDFLGAMLREIVGLVGSRPITVVVWPDLPGEVPRVIEGNELSDHIFSIQMSRPPATGGGGLDEALRKCSEIGGQKEDEFVIIVGPDSTLTPRLAASLKAFSGRHRVHVLVAGGCDDDFKKCISGYLVTISPGDVGVSE